MELDLELFISRNGPLLLVGLGLKVPAQANSEIKPYPDAKNMPRAKTQAPESRTTRTMATLKVIPLIHGVVDFPLPFVSSPNCFSNPSISAISTHQLLLHGIGLESIIDRTFSLLLYLILLQLDPTPIRQLINENRHQKDFRYRPREGLIETDLLQSASSISS